MNKLTTATGSQIRTITRAVLEISKPYEELRTIIIVRPPTVANNVSSEPGKSEPPTAATHEVSHPQSCRPQEIFSSSTPPNGSEQSEEWLKAT